MAERSVLITGASTGIGNATALHLDRAGWRVFAGVRKDVDAERIDSETSDRLTPVTIDVTDQATIDSTAKAVEAEVGSAGLGGLVNNAGIVVGGPLEHIALDDLRRQFEVNVFGQIAVTQAVLPLLRQAHGRIVFIGSLAGRTGMPLNGPYTGTKFALEGLAQSLRYELLSSDVRVALVEPGAIKTGIWEKGSAQVDEVKEQLPADALERHASSIRAMEGFIEQGDRTGIPPEKVASVVEHALTATTPRHRYLVGRDAKMLGNVSRYAPDRLGAWVGRKYLKL